MIYLSRKETKDMCEAIGEPWMDELYDDGLYTKEYFCTRIKQLRDRARQAPKPKPWPQRGDWYFFVNEIGQHYSARCSGGLFDLNYTAHHNAFRTEDHAKEAARYQMILNAQVQASFEVDPEFVPGWSDSEQEKWVPYYDSDRKKFMSICWWSTSYLSRPVSTEEKAQAMCDILNADEKLMEVMRNG